MTRPAEPDLFEFTAVGDGSATRFAGKGDRTERGKIATGGKANASYIDTPYSIAAAGDGTVYIRSLGNDVSPSASVIVAPSPRMIVSGKGGWWIVVRVLPPGMKRDRSSCRRRDRGFDRT